MLRAYYAEPVADFLQHEPAHILGSLALHHPFALEDLQKNAWLAEIRILKAQLGQLGEGFICLEYSIPRMGRRADVVLLMGGIVFVIEFKIGETQYTSYALDQALDYAVDLKNFHKASHDRLIVPVVVATEARSAENAITLFPDRVAAPLKANQHNLGQLLAAIAASAGEPVMDPSAWRDSEYHPTPTIIEAAQALYRGHSVKEITRSDAGAANLGVTAEAISQVIDTAKAHPLKAICFVTGVPGAGKTLAGLNIANERLKFDENEHAVFLSGNGPLVTVLREALARDEIARAPATASRISKKAAASRVRAFIQNIHHFRDEALMNSQPPLERVVVFDEAQRAWTNEQTAAFMSRKRNVPNFSMSEPELLISILDRHPDWAVIICLVGGGQEINTGEAGLVEWLRAIHARYPHWNVYCAPNLTDEEYLAGEAMEHFVSPDKLTWDPRLHLAVSVRSFRAENVAALVRALLEADVEAARQLYAKARPSYPIVITRDIHTARRWLQRKARASERYGLLASSGAIRLRPLGVNVRADIDVVHWFLSHKDDVRSSFYLEEVATEFDTQGLELDWTGVIWDADLRYTGGAWKYHAFQGTRWLNVNDKARRRYLKNAYRVLLTRARQGMVIVVPQGSREDGTRPPEYYDGTFELLGRIGFEVL
jgi:hypothetical protein